MLRPNIINSGTGPLALAGVTTTMDYVYVDQRIRGIVDMPERKATAFTAKTRTYTCRLLRTLPKAGWPSVTFRYRRMRRSARPLISAAGSSVMSKSRRTA